MVAVYSARAWIMHEQLKRYRLTGIKHFCVSNLLRNLDTIDIKDHYWIYHQRNRWLNMVVHHDHMLSDVRVDKFRVINRPGNARMRTQFAWMHARMSLNVRIESAGFQHYLHPDTNIQTRTIYKYAQIHGWRKPRNHQKYNTLCAHICHRRGSACASAWCEYIIVNYRIFTHARPPAQRLVYGRADCTSRSSGRNHSDECSKTMEVSCSVTNMESDSSNSGLVFFLCRRFVLKRQRQSSIFVQKYMQYAIDRLFGFAIRVGNLRMWRRDSFIFRKSVGWHETRIYVNFEVFHQKLGKKIILFANIKDTLPVRRTRVAHLKHLTIFIQLSTIGQFLH